VKQRNTDAVPVEKNIFGGPNPALSRIFYSDYSTVSSQDAVTSTTASTLANPLNLSPAQSTNFPGMGDKDAFTGQDSAGQKDASLLLLSESTVDRFTPTAAE